MLMSRMCSKGNVLSTDNYFPILDLYLAHKYLTKDCSKFVFSFMYLNKIYNSFWSMISREFLVSRFPFIIQAPLHVATLRNRDGISYSLLIDCDVGHPI